MQRLQAEIVGPAHESLVLIVLSHSLYMHAHLSSGTIHLNIDFGLHLLHNVGCERSEGSGKTALILWGHVGTLAAHQPDL